MKLEYLHSGSSDCPLIRLYDFTNEECNLLRQVFDDLARGRCRETAVDRLPFVKPIGGCQLLLRCGDRDELIESVAPRAFVWKWSCEGWKEVRDKVDSFRRKVIDGSFNWLNNEGGISVLISPSGKW